MATDTYKFFDAILKKRGVTAYRVAKETGISTVTLTEWKNGKSQPKYDKLTKIAAFLACSVDELTGAEPVPKVFTDQDLMFALFGDDENITKDDLEDVKRFAQFIKEKKNQ